jgi:hypothetical protein
MPAFIEPVDGISILPYGASSLIAACPGRDVLAGCSAHPRHDERDARTKATNRLSSGPCFVVSRVQP